MWAGARRQHRQLAGPVAPLRACGPAQSSYGVRIWHWPGEAKSEHSTCCLRPGAQVHSVDADVYLLDDPFSAVDAHTAAILFYVSCSDPHP